MDDVIDDYSSEVELEIDRGRPDSLGDMKTYLDALSADQLKYLTVNGLPALHYIATLPYKSGDRILLEQIIKLFKNTGCNFNESTDEYFVKTRPSSGFTPLLVAIQESNLPILESLLEHGARVDIYDKKGFYPIHWAIFKGDMACFKKVIQVGGLQVADEFDERFKSHAIHPVFHTAVDEGRTEMVAYLLEQKLAHPEQLAVYHGLLPTKPDYQDGFRISYKSRRNSFLRENFGMALFLTIPPEESFATVDKSDEDDPLRNLIVPFSPLTRAVRKRRIPIIEVLLKYGAKVSGYDDLHYCILRGDVEIACMLVDQLSAQGLANDEMFDKVGLHYLHPIAFETKELEDYTVKLVDLYLETGWDLNSLSKCPTRIQGFKSYEVSTSSEVSLLHLACNSGCHKLIRYLVERGANVNSPTIGNALLYPLQLSILLQDWEAVEYLISNRADDNAIGNEEILDHSGSFRTLIDPNRRKLIRRAKMKSLRISVAIVTTFIICWTPYYVMMITVLFFVPNRHQILSDDMQSGIFFFGMSNSLFNPLIYGIFHLWKPRRKELQRGISSRRTLLTNLNFERRRSSVGTILNGSIANNNRLGNGATVTGKHGSLLNTTHSNGGGGISMGPGGGTLKKHGLDENHPHDNHHNSNHHNNLQKQHHHHLNVMPSGTGGVHQLLSATQGTDGQQNSTTSSVCICSNKNGNGAMMEDNVFSASAAVVAATAVVLMKTENPTCQIQVQSSE